MKGAKPKLSTSLILILLLLALSALYLPEAANAEYLSTWSISSNYYPFDMENGSCVTYQGYMYCVGGENILTSNPSDLVFYAPISASGVGPWTGTIALPVPMEYQSCAAASGYIYCVGGFNGSSSFPMTNVYYAALSSSGVGGWTKTNSYPIIIAAESCNAWATYLFCVGGLQSAFGAVSAVYYAPISSLGVESWLSTTSYPINSGGLACAIAQPVSVLTCAGGVPGGFGSATASVYSTVLSTSSLSWSSSADYPTEVEELSCNSVASYIYCMGGANGGGDLNAVFLGQVTTSGVASWQSTVPLPATDSSLQCASSSDYNSIYCEGGDLLAPLTVYTNVIPSTVTTTSTITATSSVFVLVTTTTTATATSTTTQVSTRTATSTVTSVTTAPAVTSTTTAVSTQRVTQTSTVQEGSTTVTATETSVQTSTVQASGSGTVTFTTTKTETSAGAGGGGGGNSTVPWAVAGVAGVAALGLLGYVILSRPRAV